MAQHRVLVSCPLIQDSMGQYDEELERHGIKYDIADVEQQLDKGELLEIIDRYDGVIAGDDEFSRPVLEATERLEVIVKWGIGTDNIDEEAAAELGIAVRNTPEMFGAEVADVVLGYAIMLARRLHHIDSAVREGEWYSPRGTSLAGKTMGIIGVGDIGAAVARRASAHGMDVLGNDVRPIPDDLKANTDIEAVDKASLFRNSDFVSLNCGLTPETRGMVSTSELDALGSDGYLINTARGGLVDQDALVGALQRGTIAGAALDVFEQEPLPPDSPLTDIDDVILGSHNAQNTHEAVTRVNDRTIDNLLDELVRDYSSGRAR